MNMRDLNDALRLDAEQADLDMLERIEEEDCK